MERKAKQESKEKQPTITVHGFYYKDTHVGLVRNEKKGTDDFFFKFIIGQKRGAAVAWIPVAMRGSAAEKFCNLVMLQPLTTENVFSFTGKWQEYTNRRGQTKKELWAFGYKTVPQQKSPKG